MSKLRDVLIAVAWVVGILFVALPLAVFLLLLVFAWGKLVTDFLMSLIS